METIDRIQTIPVRSQRKLIDPAGWFADRSYGAKVWFYLFLLAVTFNMAQGPVWYSLFHRDEYVTTIDESGTFHRSPLLGFDNAPDIYRYHAELATMALFNRNPNGFDLPDLLPQMFRPNAYKHVDNYFKIDAQGFNDKKLFQKPSISNFRVFDLSEKGGSVVVIGQLLKQGEVNNERYLPDPDDFTLLLIFKRNPDMSKNGRLPLAVDSWQLKINNVLVPLDAPPPITTDSHQ